MLDNRQTTYFIEQSFKNLYFNQQVTLKHVMNYSGDYLCWPTSGWNSKDIAKGARAPRSKVASHC